MAKEMSGITREEQWERDLYRATPERRATFTTLSDEPIRPVYTERDLPTDPAEAIGLPGLYPFTRGVYPNMYRGRLWTMRQFAGFGTAEETNARFRYLLQHGQTGLSTAFDMPSLMGQDSDHERSEEEVGREGVAVDSLEDMKTLFHGIDLSQVSVSVTINAPEAVILAFYVVAAEHQGVPARELAGTIQADILKEYIAQKEWCFPIDPAMRLLGDMMEWCTHNMPRWHPVSISGYHIREAGATAAQELAFTLNDGLTYVEQQLARGIDVDKFAPRLSFFFNSHLDFFEEIAKYRAARRIWARELRDTYGATNPRSWLMRFHTQTAGVSLTAQQPLNNVVRTAIEALGGMVEAVKQGFPQREIADAAYTLQEQVDRGESIVVGVNDYVDEEEPDIELLHVNPALERKQIERLQAMRANRDGSAVERVLADLRKAAADEDRNVMPHLLDCARANATEGEIVAPLQDVFGSYREAPIY